MGSTLKTYTVLNDETSEIERDLCVFCPIGGKGAGPIIIVQAEPYIDTVWSMAYRFLIGVNVDPFFGLTF